MNDAVRDAIDAASPEVLAALVARDPSLAEADVVFGPGGRHAVPPLHYVCDALGRGRATQSQALAMADVLLAVGVDPHRAYARSGDTYLIAAASLGAEDVGCRLVALGVDVAARGLFGATALHWAALGGLDRLAEALLDAGAELELRDERYGSTPLQWVVHGWTSGTGGGRAGLARVARGLVGRGAHVPGDVLARLASPDDAPLHDALGDAESA